MKGNLRIDGAACRYWMSKRSKRGVDLARAADATEAFISRALNGRTGISDRVAVALAHELGVTVDHLLAPTATLRLAAAGAA